MDGMQALFADEGWEIIKTVPYHPETQPIELLWARVMNEVASKFKAGRTISTAMEQTCEALAQVEKTFAVKIIAKAERETLAHVQRVARHVLNCEMKLLDDLLHIPLATRLEADEADEADEGIND